MATTRYEVQHSYRSFRDGQQFGPWQAGETVELDQVDAEWVERDSPGCLGSAGAAEGSAPAVEPARAKPAGQNRQHRGGANRGS